MQANGSEIIAVKHGALGLLTLNRPQALNALTHSMIGTLTQNLENWARDDAVRSVAITSEDARAFCAGGDIRIVQQSALAGTNAGAALLKDEYRLNAMIGTYTKPYIALMNGIVMGGGAGISVHGRFRIADSTLKFAMPETAIGFFPDVGSSYFLSRCPGELGTYLALSGLSISIEDALSLGLITHAVQRQYFPFILEGLAQGKDLENVIAPFCRALVPGSLVKERACIDSAFCAVSVEQILEKLALDAESPFARQTAQIIASRSPTSLKIALRALRRARSLSLRECLVVDYRLALRVLHTHDFAEGVRATLIDKDRAPQWNPSTLAEVSQSFLEEAFRPLGAGELFAG